MKNDPQCLYVAEVEKEKVRPSKPHDLGIDFSNQIDAWSKMQFKYRRQIYHLRHYGCFNETRKSDLSPIVYSFRQKID